MQQIKLFTSVQNLGLDLSEAKGFSVIQLNARKGSA